jgi:cob(I)alamin adenosyltransferase
MLAKKSLVYLWTGNGAGKTTSALGVALRALGHNQKVVVIQFMKGRKDIGEYRIKNKLGKNYEIVQFGRKSFVNLQKPAKEDRKLAEKALEYAEKALKRKPNLLILDEVNLAAAIGLISRKKVLSIIEKADPKTTIYLIGRYAPKEFLARADFANEIRVIKQRKRIPARKGIEY